MSTETPTIESLLDNSRFTRIAALYSLSTNYTSEQSPFLSFLDLSGWSEHTFGYSFTRQREQASLLDFVSMSLLGSALVELAESPPDAYLFLDQLAEAEARQWD